MLKIKMYKIDNSVYRFLLSEAEAESVGVPSAGSARVDNTIQMPFKAKRNCPITGCPNLVTQGRCPQHTTRRPDLRPPSSQRGYSTHWHQTRGAYLKQHQVCVVCGVRATDVDHIISRAKGGSDEWSNLQSQIGRAHV